MQKDVMQCDTCNVIYCNVYRKAQYTVFNPQQYTYVHIRTQLLPEG